MLARETLHFREQVAHVFRMLALLAGRHVPDRLGQRERRFGERVVDIRD